MACSPAERRADPAHEPLCSCREEARNKFLASSLEKVGPAGDEVRGPIPRCAEQTHAQARDEGDVEGLHLWRGRGGGGWVGSTGHGDCGDASKEGGMSREADATAGTHDSGMSRRYWFAGSA
jgi:hypothetical protein